MSFSLSVVETWRMGGLVKPTTGTGYPSLTVSRSGVSSILLNHHVMVEGAK